MFEASNLLNRKLVTRNKNSSQSTTLPIKKYTPTYPLSSSSKSHNETTSIPSSIPSIQIAHKESLQITSIEDLNTTSSIESGPLNVERNLKILVIGNPKCGKSSLIKRYVQNSFDNSYKTTIGADYQRKDICVTYDENSKQAMRLQLWDIAGQDRFAKLTRVYFKNADGVIIVCDVSRERTVEAIRAWKAEIDRWIDTSQRGREIPMVLFANKADLLSTVDDAFVAGASIERVCHELGFLRWCNTSALSGTGVSEAFNEVVTYILNVSLYLYPLYIHLSLS